MQARDETRKKQHPSSSLPLSPVAGEAETKVKHPKALESPVGTQARLVFQDGILTCAHLIPYPQYMPYAICYETETYETEN
jgi:hypothetical protein